MYIKYTFVHFAILLIRQILGAVPPPATSPFAVEALSFRFVSTLGLLNTSKVHINNMYIKYTFIHFAILLIRQVFWVVPLPVTIPFAIEALSFRLRSSFGLLHRSGNLVVILPEVPILFICPFT